MVELDLRPHSLPIPPTALLGREREVAEIRALLRGSARLVTLTGAGGTGKTRLALQIAAELLDDFEQGVVLVELGPIGDPALVPSTIAQALGVRDFGGRPVLETLKEYLSSRSLLLVLDNVEHLLPATPLLAELLVSGVGLKLLVTSREPLRVRGEHEYAVLPLALPERDRLPSVAALSDYAAIALFVERAVAIRADFALTSETAPSVAEICTRLDGLPLAIELAAARIRLLSPEAILRRLDRRLPLLVDGARDLPARQQTLRGTIAWSYDHLDEQERCLFRRLSIFVGGCTVEAAEAVAGGREREPQDDVAGSGSPAPLLDALSSLVAKSLLRREPGPDGEPRFGMLETIREFGLELLEGSGEVASVRERHAAFFLALAEEAEPHLRGHEQVAWMRRLGAEHANLRAVLGWCRRGLVAADVGLRITAALSHFWVLRGFVREARDWTEAMLAQPDAARRTVPRARALYALAWLTEWQTDYAATRSCASECVEIFREVADSLGVGRALTVWGVGERGSGHHPEGRALMQQATVIAREVGDRWGLAHALGQLGAAAQTDGDLGAARALRAESAALARATGDRHMLGLALAGLAGLDRVEGNFGKSAAWFKEALMAGSELEDAMVLPRSLAGLASVASHARDHERAVRLFGHAHALREVSGTHETRLWRNLFERDIAELRVALGDTVFAAAWSDGQSLTHEQAVADALGIGEPMESPNGAIAAGASSPARAASPLSPREHEIAALVARGLTNRQIADCLVISRRTVDGHVASVLAKLDLATRTQIATWVVQREPSGADAR